MSLVLAQICFSKFFFMGFTSTRCYTLLQAIIVCNFKENKWTKPEKMAKNLVSGPFWPIWPKLDPPIFFFFFKNLTPSDNRYHGQLSSCTISVRTNDLILRKLSDGRTDGRTDGLEWFHRKLYKLMSNINWCKSVVLMSNYANSLKKHWNLPNHLIYLNTFGGRNHAGSGANHFFTDDT